MAVPILLRDKLCPIQWGNPSPFPRRKTMWAGVGEGGGGRRMERKTDVQLFQGSSQKPPGLCPAPRAPHPGHRSRGPRRKPNSLQGKERGFCQCVCQGVFSRTASLAQNRAVPSKPYLLDFCLSPLFGVFTDERKGGKLWGP